jgi:hypothetical protein
MRSIFAFVAAGAMLIPSAASAADLSRNSTPIGDQEEIAGNPWVPWAVALIAAIVILLVITDGDGEPQSP